MTISDLQTRGFAVTTEDARLRVANEGFAGLIEDSPAAIAMVADVWDAQVENLAQQT